jgi:hypothetical protein
MAIGDPYADEAALYGRLGSDDISTYEALLDAASRAVERFTRRQFNKTTSATARRFRPVDWRRVPVDDFHTVTGLVVTVDGTVWDLANVDPRPWNGIVDGQPGWPFFNLIAANRTWPRTATITVTAQWGWPAVPEGIIQATLDVAEAMFRTGGSSPVRSESIDGYSATYQLPADPVREVPPEMEKAADYRRKRFGVA